MIIEGQWSLRSFAGLSAVDSPLALIFNITLTIKGWSNIRSRNRWTLGYSEFCFPRISMFPSTLSWETLRFSGNKIHCSPRDQSLRDLLDSKANGSNRWKTNNDVIDKWRATAVNISRVTVNCFLFEVIIFAMLPAHGIWRETVSLLDVMWQWTSQWMGVL